MMAYLGLFAPVFDQLAYVMLKVVIDSMGATLPALHMVASLDSPSNLPLQFICILKIFISIFCHTARGTMSQVTNSYQLCLSKSPNYKTQTPASCGPPAAWLPALDEPNVPTPIISTLGVPDKTANQQAGPATDSKITQARTEGETENFPIEHGPPRGDQSQNLTREFELPQFKPANKITPAIDATKDWEDLVIGKTWADRICESFTMTDGHTYTLGHQEDAHCHPCNKVT
ncbi:hypothetical protein DSO57_1002570 [Entomophthora muscae]|uniref:Uncharacterized protein n=1 Tax=Entomophthora muscae TaxID=34485 RepID=A0ACC2U6V3_9FUNG|nr:hypothetical protein DSO57_1002570 [Entomophthora muscae]